MTLRRVDAGDSIGRGLLYPLRRTNSDFESGTGTKLLQSNVRKVVNTDGATEDGILLGEYPWNLEFGSSIQRLRHANIRDIQEDLGIIMVATAVARWEPRAVVLTDSSFFDRPAISTATGQRARRLRIFLGTEDDIVGANVQQQPFQTDVEVPA